MSMVLGIATFVLRVSTSAVGSADASPSNDHENSIMLGSAGRPAHVLHTRPSLCATLVQNDTPETWASEYSPAEQLRGDGAVALEWITQAHAVSPAQSAPQTIWITFSALPGDDEAPLQSPSNSSETVAIQLTGISQCMGHERTWQGRPTATIEHVASLASSMLWQGLARHWNKIATALAVVLGLFIPYLQRPARCLLWEPPPNPKPTSTPVNRVGKPHGKIVGLDRDSARPAQAHHGPSTQAGAHGSAQGGEWKTMSDEEIVERGSNGRIALYSLERVLEDPTRAVRIRRRLLSAHDATRPTSKGLAHSMLPYESYDYARVHGACCENVIGVMPLPVGVAGPLSLDGEQLFLPMATTEGVLVASTNRGCNAINASGGVTTAVLKDGMTRGPVLRFPSLERATAAKRWLESSTGNRAISRAFDSTSRFAKLQSMKSAVVGSDMFVRFQASTGDAMGMNMISKGVEASLAALASSGFQDLQVVSLSGNYCSDKKSAAVNWIEGRGKSVCAQAVIEAAILQRVLKTDVDTLVELNTSKNLVGSALAGSVGGFNAHAANIVTAIFLATGQDAAQNVESSGCLTTMKKTAGEDLEISVTMPSVEVGTVGGGTTLEPQRAMLDLLGVQGANADIPGANAQRLACVVAGAVLAGELSLCSSLAAGSLVKSHMAHNRGNG